jgi:NitT/TauT family transport system ATP-binding protein
VQDLAPPVAPPPISQRGSVVEAIDVDHFYEGQSGWVQALDRLNLAIPENEFLCILGPSGCGKSTFLKIVAGLIKPTRGRVSIKGKPIQGPGLDRGIVFQEPALFAWRTALKNVEFGLQMRGTPKAEARARAEHVLATVGLAHAAELYPYQLSGGMRHRVAVARAWALDTASLLLMDEPFSAIDAINRMTLQDHLVRIWLEERRTLLYVTHDIDEAVYLADRIVVLRPSPGRLGAEFRVDVPRPRDRNSPELAGLKAEITARMQEFAVQ